MQINFFLIIFAAEKQKVSYSVGGASRQNSYNFKD